MIVFLIGYFDEPQLKHLQDVGVPVAWWNVSTCPKRLDPVVTATFYLLTIVSTQDVHQQFQAHVLLAAHDCTQGFLRKHRAIEQSRRMMTHITVVTFHIRGFTEVVQQDSPSAHGGFGIFLHSFQAFLVDLVLRTFASEGR